MLLLGRESKTQASTLPSEPWTSVWTPPGLVQHARLVQGELQPEAGSCSWACTIKADPPRLVATTSLPAHYDEQRIQSETVSSTLHTTHGFKLNCYTLL